MQRTLWAIPLLLVTAFASAATCPNGLFIQAASVPAGLSGSAVAIGPMNADANSDVVTKGDGVLSVLMGQGDGTLGPPIVTNYNYSSYSVAIGDLDGDGNSDAVVGIYNGVLVLLGHGDGTFDDPVAYDTGIGPATGIVLVKVDANASLDIAVAGTGGIGILLGSGTGSFAPSVDYPAPAATSLVSGDFNGDGHTDLAAASGNFAAVLLGLGDGTFGPTAFYLAGSNLYGIATADLDGDAKADLVATAGSFVSVLLGNGNGTFQAALQYPANALSSSVAIADFDLDGHLDVLVASPSGGYFGNSGEVSLLRGVGDGSLEPAQTYAAGLSLDGLAVGDLNGDGLPDAVTADPTNFSVSVFIDMPDGNLYAAPVAPVPGGPESPLFVQVDFNEDGLLDLAWPNSSNVIITLGSEHGRFESGTAVPDPGQEAVFAVGAGDFSGHHHQDLILLDFSSAWLFAGNGDGTFAPGVDIFDTFQPASALIGDFNGDGHPDVALGLSCCGPSSVVVLLGNGDGTFLPPVTTSLESSPSILLVADLTGDGRADLVTNLSSSVELLPGNGDGTFGAPSFLQSSTASSATAGDFDSNGHNDLLLSNGPSVALFLADASGSLQPPVGIGVGGQSTSMAVADFDQDGHLDFAVDTGSSLVVLRGLGNGHFQTPLLFPVEANGFIAGGDYDGNGQPDIVRVTGQDITTLLNARLGATVPGAVSFVVSSPAVLHATAGGGFGPIAYQWRKNDVPLNDGGAISGSHTATLTINPVAFTDAGVYDVVVTDSCTNATSNGATLSVEFDDVASTNPFHDDIITIATSGITGGCTETSFCPSNNVSRAEMAVFLLKAKFGADHEPPPPPPDPIFPDVPADAFAAAWIDELATLGITGGCGDGNGDYCPDDPVTRGQMAVFLLKTLNGSDYVPPPPAGIFVDVPADYFAIAWIEDIYHRGITAGCLADPLSYCPDQSVPREQMATFIVRTFPGL